MPETPTSLPSEESAATMWASDVGGRVLARVFAAIRVVRERPLHPKGTIFTGHVRWVNPTGRKSGIPWIDTPPISGREGVTVRLSRSVGLPAPLPDVIGLALKFETEDGPADLALSSSWWGVPARFLLRFGRSTRGAFGSLMPYRGEWGPVEVGARTRRRDTDIWEIELLHATASSKWTRFAVVTLDGQGLPDTPDLRYDPILNVLPGASTYEWTRRLRQRSYAAARRSPGIPAARTYPVTPQPFGE